MRNRRWLIAICLFAAVLVGGCWDGRELEKRAIVLLVGIDKSQAGVRIGLQLARPQAFAGSAGEQSTPRDVVTVVTRNGADVPAALHALQLAVDRDLFFGHARVVVMSEEVARAGVWRQLQPLVGDMQIPRTSWLFIVRGSAEAVLAHKPPLDAVPATYLTNFFDNRLLLQRWYDVTVGGFHQRQVTPGEEPIAIWIAPGQPDQSAPTVLGIAAFHGDRFRGGLDREASRGWVITQNQPPPGLTPVSCPGRPGKFAVRVVRSQNRIRPRTDGESVKGLVVVAHVQGRIEAVDCRATFSAPREMERFAQAFQEIISNSVRAGLKGAQTELRSDIFGFGKAAYRYAHEAWPGDEQWAKLFPELPIEVNVNVRLDYTGSYRNTSD